MFKPLGTTLARIQVTKMKITKQQLRKIIKEERARLLKEYENKPIDDDAQYVATQIAEGLFDALEELGADAQTAREIHHLLKTTAWLDSSLDTSLNSYLKKLNMMGGKPKPRSV